MLQGTRHAIADGARVLTASASEPPKDGDVVADERLGGLLRSYRRSA